MPSQPENESYIAGGQRRADPDGGYTVPTGDGLSVRQLPNGNIEGEVPSIRMLTIADVSQVERHDIAHVYDTVSHTLHFAGGGVLSYMHAVNGCGYEISGRCVHLEVSPDGTIVVFGTLRA
ncbi:hypothetical protein SGO26_17800 [Cupriavidus metallidurans]|uniref:hypothetical protein n=1 Tax=Cupriavidus TaxID=106589 RepID=UPI000E8B50E6|nr:MULTISPECIES: hypothetical protein [unclassified Cupriavidus]GMG92744.1 hypothetical protein Cmtc_39640 [Cupriavidus sp. TKC]HBD35722.1 hypothetical protein [Cupriavidus sp.]HBO82718.1 hypothetical protein [Cupriavidus sp.]